jgi:hypothetical protein
MLLLQIPDGASAQSASACSLHARSEFVAILVCPPGLKQDDWKQSGVTACGNIPACSAWMWDDIQNLPKSAPRLASGLTSSEVASAVAIWDSAGNRLVTIEKIEPR